MYNLFENNLTGDNSTYIGKVAQSFTPSTAHTLRQFAYYGLGAATVEIWTNVDDKPGVKLAETTTSASTLDWCYAEFDLELESTKYWAVVDGTVRYQSTGTYGKLLVYGTWADTGGSMLFMDRGTLRNLYGTYRVTLYPSGEGTYTQLYQGTGLPNYARVNDLIGSTNHFTGVSYDLRAAAFKSGESEGVAGDLTGTCRIRTDVAGIYGDGTQFSTELSAGTLLYTTGHVWYTGTDSRVLKVQSVQNNTTATLDSQPTSGVMALPWQKYFYWTPINSTDADGRDSGMSTTRSILGAPFKTSQLEGTWTLTNGSKIATGVGGNALTAFPLSGAMMWVGVDGVAGPGQFRYGTLRRIDTVDNNNQITFYDNYTSTTYSGTANYCWAGQEGTVWWADPTKRDSYSIKTTKNTGTIHRMLLRFSVLYVNWRLDSQVPKAVQDDLIGVEQGKVSLFWWLVAACLQRVRDWMVAEALIHTTWDITYSLAMIDQAIADWTVYNIDLALAAVTASIEEWKQLTVKRHTATARPFVYSDGVFSYGDEVTVKSHYLHPSDPYEKYAAVVETYEIPISRPGGGIFTKEDLETLEVGIILGGFSDERSLTWLRCTQLCLIAEISNLPSYAVTQTQQGMNSVGFLAYDDGWDEFDQYGDPNTLGWTVSFLEVLRGFFTRPMKRVREKGIRIVRPITRVTKFRRR